MSNVKQEHKSALVKSVYPNNGKPYIVYLIDGTKINLKWDKGNAWMEIVETPIAVLDGDKLTTNYRCI